MDLEEQRRRMIQDHLLSRGLQDPAVLAAMEEVPREEFVPEELKPFAYQDRPLPIGEGQTISQPFIVARMIEYLALHPDDRVLEIGTGSGYGSAVLSRIAKTVYTIERYSDLACTARKRLARLGYPNVHVAEGDGSLGWPENAPYNAIVGTAGAPDVPVPLKEQLSINGRLVLPVGPLPEQQTLVRLIRKAEKKYSREQLEAVRFVPLVGKAGWH